MINPGAWALLFEELKAMTAPSFSRPLTSDETSMLSSLPHFRLGQSNAAIVRSRPATSCTNDNRGHENLAKASIQFALRNSKREMNWQIKYLLCAPTDKWKAKCLSENLTPAQVEEEVRKSCVGIVNVRQADANVGAFMECFVKGF